MNKLFYFLFEIKIYCDKDFELLFNYLIFFIKFFFTLFLYLFNGDWGLGIGDWGLGIGYFFEIFKK